MHGNIVKQRPLFTIPAGIDMVGLLQQANRVISLPKYQTISSLPWRNVRRSMFIGMLLQALLICSCSTQTFL